MENENNKSFQGSLWVEEEARTYIEPYYKNLYWIWFKDVRKDERYQSKDIDFLLNWITVELKALSKVYNNVFLFEMYKWSDEYEDEYKWAFLTSQADSRLITDNENREGWYFRMKDLRKLILDLKEDKSQENKIYRIKKNYEKIDHNYLKE